VLEILREVSRPHFRQERRDDQVFKDWEFLIDGREEFLRILNRYYEADATDTITLLESKHQPPFIFCTDVGIFINIFDDKWKGR